MFSTKEYDLETGLYYYGYRFYMSLLAQWTTRDPKEEAGGLNLYGFANNNPMNWVDPDGQFVAAAGALLRGAVIIGGAIVSSPAGQQAMRDIGEAINNAASSISNAINESGKNTCKDKSDDDNKCEKLYQTDTATCNGITRVRGAAAGAKCHASASQRYAAYLRGQPIPPLNTWNN